MLILVFCWLQLTLSVLSAGAGLVCLLRADSQPLKAPLTAAAGLGAVAALTSLWSLALPLGHGYGAGLFGLTLAPLLSSRVRRLIATGFDWKSSYSVAAPALAFLFACALLKATGPTEVFDDAVGYITIFRSMLDEGVIIGFGNLHPNFAYNSHWSLLGAFYSFEWLWGRPLYDINGWVAWLGAWYAFSFLPALWRGQVRGLYLLIAATPFFFFRNQMGGNSTDLPISIVTWMLLAEWLLGTGRGNPRLARLLYVGMPLFCFTIKVTALSLLILPLGLLWEQPRRQRPGTLSFGLAAAGFTLGPWFARNVLMTGYLYFLAPGLDLLLVDWKMPLTVIGRLKAQVATDIHHAPKRLADPAWWREWWTTGHNLQNQIIIALAFGGALIAGLATVFNLSRLGRTRHQPRLLTFCLVQGIGILFWFSAATEPRYGHAALTFAALGLVCWMAARLPPSTLPALGKGFVVLMTGAMALAAYRSLKEFTPFVQEVALWPAPYPVVEWQNVRGRNFTAHFPYRMVTDFQDRLRFPAQHTAAREKTPNCWCTPLPCIYRRQDLPLLEQRGPSLRDGFRYTAPPKD